MVAGWCYQKVSQLNFDRDSWTWPLDARRIGPREDAAVATVAQVRGVLARLGDTGGPVPLFVFDAGSSYDPAWLTHELAGQRAQVASVSDILCAGFFPVRYQMFIRYSFFALSDVLVPVLFSGSGESGFPCCSWADAACPGFLPVVLVPGAAALSLPGHLAAVPVGDLNIADSDGRGG